MIDVIFNGVILSNYAKIMDVRRDILAPRVLQTLNVPKRDGVYLFGKKNDARIFEVDIMFIGDVETKRAQLAEVLDTDVLVPLEFSDKPGVEYPAILTEDTQLTQAMHTARATLRFLVAEPFGYGASYLATIPSTNLDGIEDIEIYGDAPVFPVIRATFTQDTPAFAVIAGDRYLQLGTFQDTETTPKPYEELIFWDRCESLTGWTPLSGTLEDNQLTGAGIVTNGYSFSVQDFGEGNAWHGSAISKPLDEPLTDFLFQAKVQMKSIGNDAARQMGKIDFYFRNASNEIIGKMTMREDNLNVEMNRAQTALGYFGYRDVILDRKDKNLNDFDGLFRMRRYEGNKINAYYGQIRNGRQTWSTAVRTIDVNAKFADPITSVVVAINAFGEHPATAMYVEDIKFWKLNEVQPGTEVNQIFRAGDVLEIDMAKGRVILNEVDAIRYMVPGSQFFALNPGTETLGVPGGVADVEITYRSRWR